MWKGALGQLPIPSSKDRTDPLPPNSGIKVSVHLGSRQNACFHNTDGSGVFGAGGVIEKTNCEAGVLTEGAHQSVTWECLMWAKGPFKERLRNTGPFPIASLRRQGPEAH